MGTAGVGRTVSTTLTISETGEATLIVTPTLSGADAGNFSVAPSLLTILDGGAAQNLSIECMPSVTGTLEATLTVTHNAPGSPVIYSLSCTGESHYIYLPLVLSQHQGVLKIGDELGIEAHQLQIEGLDKLAGIETAMEGDSQHAGGFVTNLDVDVARSRSGLSQTPSVSVSAVSARRRVERWSVAHLTGMQARRATIPPYRLPQ